MLPVKCRLQRHLPGCRLHPLHHHRRPPHRLQHRPVQTQGKGQHHGSKISKQSHQRHPVSAPHPPRSSQGSRHHQTQTQILQTHSTTPPSLASLNLPPIANLRTPITQSLLVPHPFPFQFARPVCRLLHWLPGGIISTSFEPLSTLWECPHCPRAGGSRPGSDLSSSGSEVNPVNWKHSKRARSV